MTAPVRDATKHREQTRQRPSSRGWFLSFIRHSEQPASSPEKILRLAEHLLDLVDGDERIQIVVAGYPFVECGQ